MESLNDVDKLVESDKLVLVDVLNDVETLSLLTVDVDALPLVDVEMDVLPLVELLNDVDVLPDSEYYLIKTYYRLLNPLNDSDVDSMCFHLMIHLKSRCTFRL